MATFGRNPIFVFIAVFVCLIASYYLYNMSNANMELDRKVKIYADALSVSKERNKLLIEETSVKMKKKEEHIKQLEKENFSKHTALGKVNSQLDEAKKKLSLKNEVVGKLHRLAEDHKRKIATLGDSVSKSKEELAKLSEKTNLLMSEHTKLKQERNQLQKENDQLKTRLTHEQTEKSSLNDRLNSLVKQKQDLGVEIEDLRRKNYAIKDSIKQKIKESYDAYRVKRSQGIAANPLLESNNQQNSTFVSHSKGGQDVSDQAVGAKVNSHKFTADSVKQHRTAIDSPANENLHNNNRDAINEIPKDITVPSSSTESSSIKSQFEDGHENLKGIPQAYDESHRANPIQNDMDGNDR